MGVKPSDFTPQPIMTYEQFEEFCDYALLNNTRTHRSFGVCTVYEFSGAFRIPETQWLTSIQRHGQRYAMENDWVWVRHVQNGYKIKPASPLRLWFRKVFR